MPVTASANLTCAGDGSANVWNAQNAAKWKNGAASSQFFNLDSVTFDDTGSALPPVNLVGTLLPAAITVINGTKNYTLSGTGGLSGTPLTEDGAGSLTFNNTGNNSVGGRVAITNGAVTFGYKSPNTFVNGLAMVGGRESFMGGSTNNFTAGTSVAIGAGASLTSANINAVANTFNTVPIQLDGTLTVTQAVNSTVDGVISGAGTLIKAGSGSLTLASDNSGLSAVVQINGGTIKAGTTTALGTGGVIITNSATLDLNGKIWAHFR